MRDDTKLASGSLSIWESITMGVAGAAPAFSVTTASATLIGAVGVLAPANILYCGLLMFGITLAFIHLNKVTVNAGTSYAWVSMVFGPTWGFFAGWALLVASAIFMVSGSVPAATATLTLVAPDLVNSTGWVTFVAALWLSLISLIVCKGIKLASIFQVVMTSIEVVLLVAIIIAGLIQLTKHPVHPFSYSWFYPGQFTPSVFVAGALTAVFFYWGWDVTLNLNEETENAAHIPGWGAFWSMLVVMLLFTCFLVSALLILTDTEIQNSGTNILFALADKMFPRPWSYIAIVAVLLSASGTLETTILQFTRTLFAKGRDNALHPRYAVLHKSWNTPWVAIVFIWMFGMTFLFISSYFPSVNSIIKDSVSAIGFQVAFYYGLTGLACAWYYRHNWKSIGDLLGYIVWPILSAFFLFGIAICSVFTFDIRTTLIGLGGLAIGVVPMIMNERRKKQDGLS
jgi:amino acid transporter